MSFKKILLLLVIIILVIVGFYFFLQEPSSVEAPLIEGNGTEAPLVGGDRDEHGCIGSAGYAWCEAKGECLRPWEEGWDESCGPKPGAEEVVNNEGGEAVACTMDAKKCSDGSFVGRVAPDCEYASCPDEKTE